MAGRSSLNDSPEPGRRAGFLQPAPKRFEDFPHALFHLQLGEGIQGVPQAVADFILRPGALRVVDRGFKDVMFGVAIADAHQVEQVLGAQSGFLREFSQGGIGMRLAALDSTARQGPAAFGLTDQEDVAVFFADDGRSNFHKRCPVTDCH